MELGLSVAALVLSLCACVVTVLLYLHREETHDLTSKQRSLELELADVVDRLSIWQRRDAARGRTVAGRSADERGGSEPMQHPLGFTDPAAVKAQLRVVARQRGLIK